MKSGMDEIRESNLKKGGTREGKGKRPEIGEGLCAGEMYDYEH